MRATEYPQYLLMVDSEGRIVTVRQEYEQEKVAMGWALVARETDVLPFNAPRLVMDDTDDAA